MFLALAAACGKGSGEGHNNGSAAATDTAKRAKEPIATPRRPVDDLVDKAEKLLTASVAIDYQRPMSATMPVREPVREAFYDACRAGDHRSCWMVREVQTAEAVDRAQQGVRPPLYESDAIARTIENCRQGDRLSCSALYPGDVPKADDLPGHAGRSEGCRNYHGACDMAALARECSADYAASCVALRKRQSLDADRTALTAAARRLTREGCHAGILRDCEDAAMLYRDDLDSEQYAEEIFAREQICTISLSWCDKLGELYLPGDADKAAVAFERECQFSPNMMERARPCSDVWRKYTASRSPLREPVPGRAAQLRDWACKKYHTCW